ALAFMVFVLLYVPCIATITAIVKESGSWKYGAFTLVYNTAVAWLLAFIVYQIGSL
ncbi:MAG: nucleoside recognition domain-containing protein, partial [Bacteroidales bacterium]|nr:nucleoside recognition domain-containing protein [Bacteroidales bacterium]